MPKRALRHTVLSKPELWNFHWGDNGLSLVTIARKHYSDDIYEVMNDLDYHEIPIRSAGVKIRRQFEFLYETETSLYQQKLKTSNEVFTTQEFVTEGFRSFTLEVYITKTGTPSDSYILIEAETSTDRKNWHKYTSAGWGGLFYSYRKVVAGELLSFDGSAASRYLWFKFTPVKVTTLNSSNYFTIQNSVVIFQ